MGTYFPRQEAVDGAQVISMKVEHTFDEDLVVKLMMVCHNMLRPRPGVEMRRALRVSEVRHALQSYAKHRQPNLNHPILDELEAEQPDGPVHLLEEWIRGELYRLGVFDSPTDRD